MNTTWLAIELPHLALDLLCRGQGPGADLPIAISDHHASRPRVVDSNPAARRLGIQAGMPINAALALAANVYISARKTSAEHQALQGLAGWAYQYSSQVSILSERQTLLLEVAGSRRLFGSAQSLLRRLERELPELGYHARLGFGPTPQSACLAARHGLELHNQQELHQALQNLPLSALILEADQFKALEKMGFQWVRDVLRLPRKSLARRLGPSLVDYLDRLCAIKPDPQTAWQAPASWSGKLELTAEINNSRALLFPLKRMVLELCGTLRAGDYGVQQLELRLGLRRGEEQLMLGLQQPGRDAQRIMRLLRERLERLRLTSPARFIQLKATRLLPFSASQDALFPNPDEPADDVLIPLLERLQARLGKQAVYGLTGVQDHRPEHSWGRRALDAQASCCSMPHRPLWLYPQPQPCQINSYKLLAGPERIESGWWDGRDCRRDYYIVQDKQGSTLWAYHEYKPGSGWFLHGVFG